MGSTEQSGNVHEGPPVSAARARAIAHDTRNAIGLIWMHLAMLDRKLTGNPDATQSLEAIRAETRLIVALMNDLTDQTKG